MVKEVGGSRTWRGLLVEPHGKWAGPGAESLVEDNQEGSLIRHYLLLCGLASLLVPAIVPASTAAGAETCVRAFNFAERVGGEVHRGYAPTYDELLTPGALPVPRGSNAAFEAALTGGLCPEGRPFPRRKRKWS